MTEISFNKLPFNEYVETQRKYGLDQKTLFEKLQKGLAPLNFDADNRKNAKRIARNLLKRFGKRKGYQIFFRKSSSRRGYHFTVFKDGRQLFLTIRGSIKIRHTLGDCWGRIDCDKLRAKHNLPISILFHHKNRKEATVYRELKFINQVN
jgi:hypothetical protein